MPPHRPVFVIPGYYGSELIDTGADNFREWIDENSVLHPIEVLNALRLDTGDPNRIVASGPLDHFSLLGFIHIGIFSALRQFLRDQLGYPEADIHVIGVDWRRSIVQLAKDLDLKIQQSGAQEVDIIAHSHGGLVAREYLHQFNGGRAKSLIAIATPHKGMFKTFKAVYEGFQFLTFPPDHLRRTARTFPSAYELLPFDPNDELFTWNGNAADATAEDGWCETQEMKTQLRAANAVVHALPSQIGVDAAFIYGTRLPTTVLAEGLTTKLTFKEGTEGDSTVPLVSARGNGITSSGNAMLRRYPIPLGVHGSLFADDYAFELLRGLLAGAPPKVWFAVRWTQSPNFTIHSRNTVVAEFRDEMGNAIQGATVTLRLDNQSVGQLVRQDLLDYTLDVNMPGAGSVLQWTVEATAPNVPAQRRSGVLFAQNN